MSPFNHPHRNQLHHEIPFKIHPDHKVFFLTICGEPRGQNQLATEDVFSDLKQTTDLYNHKGKWWCHLLLAMPDHVHLIARIPDTQRLSKVVGDWKKFFVRSHAIRWQRNYFDHRLRSSESYRQKSEYILENPVRAGLVDHFEDWPYRWVPEG
ncbi:MAG: transposase [Verrucomicrobiota bacterium]